MEEEQLAEIVGKAWMNVEKEKIKAKASPCKKPKKQVHIKSQNTLAEEAELEVIVGKAWANSKVLKEESIK